MSKNRPNEREATQEAIIVTTRQALIATAQATQTVAALLSGFLEAYPQVARSTMRHTALTHYFGEQAAFQRQQHLRVILALSSPDIGATERAEAIAAEVFPSFDEWMANQQAAYEAEEAAAQAQAAAQRSAAEQDELDAIMAQAEQTLPAAAEAPGSFSELVADVTEQQAELDAEFTNIVQFASDRRTSAVLSSRDDA